MSVASVSVGGDFRIGDVMSRAWRVFTGNLVFFLAVPFVTNIITVVGVMIFVLLFVLAGQGTGSYALMGVGIFLGAILVLGLYMVGQGVLLLGAFQRLRGQTLRVGEAVQRVLARFVPLVGIGVLWGLALAVVGIVSSAILAGLGAVFGGWVVVLTPLFFVLAAILFVMWAVVVPACIVEGLGPIVSMARSAELTKGFRWRVFGIIFLLVLLLVAGYVVQVILGFASQALGTVFGMLWGIFWTGYFNCNIIMMYHDLRVAKEGVDTEQIASVFD